MAPRVGALGVTLNLVTDGELSPCGFFSDWKVMQRCDVYRWDE